MLISEKKQRGQGYLLTRQARDVNGRIVITLWLNSQRGPVELIISGESALFFVQQSDIKQSQALLAQHNLNLAKVSNLSLKTFSQQPVSALYFDTLRDFYLARDLLKRHVIKCFEDDFRPDDRFLMERFITADIEFIGQPQQKLGYIQYQHVQCKAPPSKNNAVNLSMVSIDIECAGDGSLYSFGIYSADSKIVFMIGEVEQTVDKSYIIEWVANEQALLTRILQWFKQYDPDIIIGWNVIAFDFNLLQKRLDKYSLLFDIGRDGSTVYWRSSTMSDQIFMEIAGRVVLDGIDLMKTATYSFNSFSLDNVANEILGVGKIVDDVENRLEEITNNFQNNKQKLAAYNLMDCQLVWQIFAKTNLLEFAILRSQLTGLAIDRIGGSVAAFTNLYLPKLHRSGYIAPNMGDGHSELVSPGGYVMDSVPGLYENIVVLDFKSLYPSIIRTFKIDPMGLIEGLIEHNKQTAKPIEGFDGAYFSRDKHFLPDIIQSLWQERDKAKKQDNAALSQAIKIIMNSFYGILGSTGCRFFDPRLSGSITKRSHQLLKQTKTWIETKGYQVIYGDTDSIFVHINNVSSSDECLRIGNGLQDEINSQLQTFLLEQYQVESALEIEFETHFSQFFMPMMRGQATNNINSSIGTKKRYAGVVAENKLIFKGMETVRSDWTPLSKTFQQNLYQRIFAKENIDDYIKDIVAKTEQGTFDHLLVFRKRLRRKLADYVKNVPPHVKAARLADELNHRKGRPLKYQKKGWIEYYITLDGPQPKEYLTSPLDYDFYIERQLKAIADDILPFINTSFSQIVDKQLGLF